MGQKVHPVAFRLGYIKTWKSRWFAKEDFPALLQEDIKIRNFIKQKFSYAGVSRVEIDRPGDKAKVSLYTARPGVIIGRGGKDIDRLRDELQDLVGREIYIDIKEIKVPQIDAQLIAENICLQLERRVSFRRAMKRAIDGAIQSGAEGIKIRCAGRLGGAEIARRESYRKGKVPLHTLKADIDYAAHEAHTTYGLIGVKVWVYKGEVLKGRPLEENKDGVSAKKG